MTWDVLWFVDCADDDPDLQVRALGFDALTSIDGWRSVGLPRAALASSPAVWFNGQLVAAPVANPDKEWTAYLKDGDDAYFSALLSH